MWDSLLRALVPLLPVDGDIAGRHCLSEARIGETHGELGMDFSGVYVSQWRKTLEGHSLLE